MRDSSDCSAFALLARAVAAIVLSVVLLLLPRVTVAAGLQTLLLTGSATESAAGYNSYLFTSPLPDTEKVVGVTGITGTVSYDYQQDRNDPAPTSDTSVILGWAGFIPKPNGTPCPQGGVMALSADQTVMPGAIRLSYFVLKHVGSGHEELPFSVQYPTPIATSGCFYVVMGGGNPDGSHPTVTMNVSLSLLYRDDVTVLGYPPFLYDMADEFCIGTPSGCFSYTEDVSVPRTFILVQRVPEPATIIALVGNVSEGVLHAPWYAPVPQGQWGTTNAWYVDPSCAHSLPGTGGVADTLTPWPTGGSVPGRYIGGSADYLAAIPATAQVLERFTLSGTGTASLSRVVSTPANVSVSAGDCLVHIVQINANGAVTAESQVHLLTRFSSSGSSYSPLGSIDSIGADGTLHGWALDPDDPSASITVHLYIDAPAGSGQQATAGAVANEPASVPIYGGNHGFSFTLPQSVRDGTQHMVYVYGIDATGNANTALIGSPASYIFATSCTFNSQTLVNGTSVTAYQSSSVPSGQRCVSQTRTCTNGTLSGSYTNASCTVQSTTVNSGGGAGAVVTPTSTTVTPPLITLTPLTSTTTTSSSAIDTLRAQVATLLAKLSSLQKNTTTPVAPAPTTSGTSSSCPSLTHNISRGSRGADVTTLQTFLTTQYIEYTSDYVTGYFGPMTQAALQQWQKEHNIVSSGSPTTTGYGAAGPKTRAAIAASCK